MKIENKEVSVKIGNKTKTFKNLILNSYLNLFADSFIDFKNKDLPYCFVNITKTNSNIDENSTTMEYDTILEADFSNNIEILTENTLINKYYYKNLVNGENSLSNYLGQTIKELGFGNYDYETESFKIYAFLDVSRYDLYIQKNQPIIISRIDKITSDMKMYSTLDEIKGPIHLTTRGLLETKGMEYDTVVSKLHSVGFGTLYNKIEDEFFVDELKFEKDGIGSVSISSGKYLASFPSSETYPSTSLYPAKEKELKIENKGEGLYPSFSLYPSQNNYMMQSTQKWIIYKFKLFRIRSEGTEEIIEDTGEYYYQSKHVNMFGKLKLKVKYERG